MIRFTICDKVLEEIGRKKDKKISSIKFYSPERKVVKARVFYEGKEKSREFTDKIKTDAPIWDYSFVRARVEDFYSRLPRNLDCVNISNLVGKKDSLLSPTNYVTPKISIPFIYNGEHPVHTGKE